MEILSNKDALIPIFREKELEIKSFVMGFHVYRSIWKPFENEVLLTQMEPTYTEDKFTVAVIDVNDSVIGHLMKGKSGRFAKTIYYFLRASEHHKCKVRVTGSAINQGDNKGMKVPCTLMFTGQSEFIDMLSHELNKHM